MKQKTLTCILGLLPSYLSLFCPPMWAAIIMGLATFIGVILTGTLDSKSPDWQRERIREAWICHLIGLCIVVLIHRIID